MGGGGGEAAFFKLQYEDRMTTMSSLNIAKSNLLTVGVRNERCLESCGSVICRDIISSEASHS